MQERKKTICNRDCPDTCGIVATIENGKVTRLQGDPDHPVTRGFLCYRTSHFLSTQYSPERLQAPLFREKLSEPFREISWEEALDYAAAKLLAIRETSGPAAIFHYRSGGSLGILKALTDYFFECFGPVTTKRGDICSGAAIAAQTLDFGESESSDLFDLLHAKNIVIWGKNVYASSPHTLPVLREAKARGSKLFLIDPVWQRTATLCDHVWQPRPGTDISLVLAIVRLLFERGQLAANAVEYCENLEEFLALVSQKTVAEFCQEADVPIEAAERLAAAFAEKPCAILVGWGMGRRANGGAIVRALDALSAVSGNLGISGGGASFYYKRRRAFPHTWIRDEEVAPRTICEPLFGPEVLAAQDPPIRAVWITAGNPVAMLPESDTTVRALETREFVVVVDSFLTDTAKRAHLVLPTTTLLEEDDLLGAYGHHWIGASTPVVERPENVRSDLEIVQALADRLGLGGVLAGTPREWKERFLSEDLRAQGISAQSLEEKALRNPLAPKVVFENQQTKTASQKVVLQTQCLKPEEDKPQFPLELFSLSTEKSQCAQWVTHPEGLPEVTVHPMASVGIADGEEAMLVSEIASLHVRVRHDARQRRDVVLIPKGGHFDKGHCANRLVRARTTDLGEGGALYDTRVRLQCVDEVGVVKT